MWCDQFGAAFHLAEFAVDVWFDECCEEICCLGGLGRLWLVALRGKHVFVVIVIASVDVGRVGVGERAGVPALW